MREWRYVVILPARNEGALIAGALEALASQSLLPAACVVVNDGSSDGTGNCVDAFAREHDWISVVHRPDRGCRASGVGVVESVLEGIAALSVSDWEFLVKLDADLTFDNRYFERCFACFEADPQLGIGGGRICVLRDGVPVTEFPGDPRFHVRGATKIYRRACWDQIGGVVRSTGWDTIDELMANQRGWGTYTFNDIYLIQHRETGRAEARWRDYIKNGRANYLTGYHPLFMFLKCSRRLFSKEGPVCAIGLGIGYLSAWARRQPRAVNADFLRYVRRQQLNGLLGRQSLWSR